MRERVWIAAGLFVFVGAVTYPVWHNLEARTTAQPPALVLPAREKECVAPVSFMRSSHMKLLLEWRDQVVRNDRRRYVSSNGKVYAISLTQTCMQCHEKKGFCDRCHEYAGVRTPYCFNCHVDPALAEVKRP